MKRIFAKPKDPNIPVPKDGVSGATIAKDGEMVALTHHIKRREHEGSLELDYNKVQEIDDNTGEPVAPQKPPEPQPQARPMRVRTDAPPTAPRVRAETSLPPRVEE